MAPKQTKFGRHIVFAPFLITSPEPTCCYSTFLVHYDYITPTVVGWCIAILRIFCTIIMAPKRSLWDILLLLCFLLLLILLLLLHHPDYCRVMYSYSTFLFHYYYYSYSYSYYSSSTHFSPLDFWEMPWSNFMKPCRNIICHVKLCL